MDIPKEKLRWIYERMVTIRRFEDRVAQEFAAGKLPGFVHLYAGEEAIAVGVCAHLTDRDYITSTHRGHGHCIAKGVDVRSMMAELFGRSTGACKGKGGSMHIADVDKGMLGANGIVGGGPPLACGAGLMAKVKGTDQVAACFFGDGAAEQGTTHEAMNLAAIWKLPVVYILENNLYQAVTRVEMEDANAAAGEPLATKARAYSMPGVTIDGTDPLAVLETVSSAVERARRGEGPTLIESVFYRFSAHGNIIVPPPVPLHFEEHEAITIYKCAEEYEQWRQRDPIPRFRAWLQGWGIAEDELAAIDAAAREEMDDAVRFALESPWPDPTELPRYVYA